MLQWWSCSRLPWTHHLVYTSGSPRLSCLTPHSLLGILQIKISTSMQPFEDPNMLQDALIGWNESKEHRDTSRIPCSHRTFQNANVSSWIHIDSLKAQNLTVNQQMEEMWNYGVLPLGAGWDWTERRGMLTSQRRKMGTDIFCPSGEDSSAQKGRKKLYFGGRFCIWEGKREREREMNGSWGNGFCCLVVFGQVNGCARIL